MNGSNRGFTLIELLAATALAAALTAGILVVVVRLNRAKEALLRAPEYPIEVRTAFDVVRSDVEQAHAVGCEDGTLRLTGFNAAHRPAVIAYRFEDRCLVREERELDRRDGEGAHRELVLAEVEAFRPEEIRRKLRITLQLGGRKYESWVLP